jgi:hypothetical protein
MTARKPLVLNSGQIQQLQSGDTLDASCNEVDVVSLTSEEAADATTIGMPVYISSTAKFKQAKADAVGTAWAIGVCRAASIASGASGDIQTSGQLTSADWTAVIGAASLTAGARYFLSEATKGMLTATPPATGFVVQVGIALSTTMLDIDPEQPIQL